MRVVRAVRAVEVARVVRVVRVFRVVMVVGIVRVVTVVGIVRVVTVVRVVKAVIVVGVVRVVGFVRVVMVVRFVRVVMIVIACVAWRFLSNLRALGKRESRDEERQSREEPGRETTEKPPARKAGIGNVERLKIDTCRFDPNVENTRLRLVLSTFPSCSQMPVVFYHSVIHGLGFFIC